MTKIKGFVALLVMVGLPLVFAALLSGAGLAFANQTVVEKKIVGDEIVTRVYDHGPGAIVAGSGGIALAWLVLTILSILVGQYMWRMRDREWL